MLLGLSLLVACAHRVPVAPEPVGYQQSAPLPAAPRGPKTTDVAEERQLRQNGKARLSVADLEQARADLARIASAHGGRVLRIAAAEGEIAVSRDQFDAAWTEVLALGTALDQAVVIDDVTDQYLAVDLRIRALNATRDRLIALVAKAGEDAEKLALLAQLQQVTDALDALRQSAADLARDAALATIQVSFVRRDRGFSGPRDPAVFTWISDLTPFARQLLGQDRHRVELPIPDGMVAVSPRGPLVAEGPDGSALWTARLPHDPRGDGRFWVDAVRDRLGSQYTRVDQEDVGRWRCVLFGFADEKSPYTWQICVVADPASRKLVVGQAFYPDAAALARYRPAVDSSLAAGPS
jgi:hypothetical protein